MLPKCKILSIPLFKKKKENLQFHGEFVTLLATVVSVHKSTHHRPVVRVTREAGAKPSPTTPRPIHQFMAGPHTETSDCSHLQ